MTEQARLFAVAGYLDLQPQASKDLFALCELTTLACDVPNAAVNLIDDRSQHEVAAFGYDPSICSREDAMCTVAITGDTDIYVEDARTDRRLAANPWVDGRLGAVRLYASARLRSPAGHVVGTLCVFDEEPGRLSDRRRAALTKLAAQVVDVFELQVLTRRLAETIKELSRSQEQLRAFAGQVSHDLKTPLTASMGFAELLGELPNVAGDPVATRYAERCLSSGQRMLSTIDELLGYAQLGGSLSRASVALDDVLREVVEDLGELADDASVRWSGDDIVADPGQLRWLLQNLIGNALTYRRAGRPAEVTVTSLATLVGTELTVVDNGSGIPAGRRADALRPLTRIRTEVAGTGLGLATCSRIVAAHGGTLHLGDSPSGGTTVTVLLPR
jgi:signal transduction histidine kinase